MTAETDRYEDEQVRRRVLLLNIEQAENLLDGARQKLAAAERRVYDCEGDVLNARADLHAHDDLRVQRLRARGIDPALA